MNMAIIATGLVKNFGSARALDGLDLAEGGPALAIDPYDETLVGDVTGRFTPREMAF